MPRSNPAQLAFNSGEFSGQLASRMDFAKYPFGAEIMRNILPLIEGGMTRRPGTRHVVEVGTSSIAARLLPFAFSVTQAYVVQAQNRVFKFIRNQGQITVADTDALIANGTFGSNVTSWDDRSTGATSIAHEFVNPNIEGTFDKLAAVAVSFGDGVANARAHGFKFNNTNAGDVNAVKINVSAVTTAFNAQCGIYTDNAGSPGTQVGSNSASVNLNSTGVKTFTPTATGLSAATDYWVVIEDVSAATGQVSIDGVNDQGSTFATGSHDTITSITDGANQWSAAVYDLQCEIRIVDSTLGAMALKGDGTDIAWAEQDVTTTNTNQEHVLKFRILGAPGDTVEFRVGTTTKGDQLVADKIVKTGFHAIAFTPTASPFYVQFRNKQNKTVHIDDVSLLDNKALSVQNPYLTADLFQIKHAQSADVMYITHKSYPVYKLLRGGHTTWSVEEVRFEDGPYLPQNDTTTTLLPSANTGLGITLTFSSTAGVNDGAGLTTNDIGRSVRYKKSANWGWAIIVDVVSTTIATADVIADFEATPTAVTTWRLGAWSATTGYPATATLFEQRLVLAGSTDNPQTFWASQSADFENMTPDNRDGTNDGTVEDDDALSFTLGAEQVNAIRWISGGAQLFIGTVGGEFLVKSSGGVLKPTDIDVKQHTTHGSADIQPVRAGPVVLYIQAAGRKLRELVFDDIIQGLKSPNLTQLAPHVLEGGAVQLAFQEEQGRVVWVVRGDGQLQAMAYEREENVVGWSRHIMGGSFSTGDPVVESVAVIPGNNGAGQTFNSEDRDEVWLVVKRTINGATKRYIEFFEGMFEGPLRDDYATDAAYETQLLTEQKNAFYVDSGLTYDGVATTTLTGLDHLEGETVAVWGDGKEQASKTVSGGSITVDSLTQAHVGLPYTHAWKSLKNSAGAARGSPMGQRSRIHKVVLALKETLSGQIGPNQATLFDIVFPAAISGTTKPLFTGELEVDDFDGDWESDPRIFMQDSAPAPLTVTAIASRVSVNEL